MLKKFGKYILQIIAGMIGISIYILADTYFISIYAGADGLAVLNLILPVYGVMYAVGALIGIGSATRYEIDKATGKNTDTCFLHSLLWSLLCSIPFVLVGIFSPFFICNYTFTAFARNDHATSTSMLGSIAGSMFNIVFDYVFMFSLHLGLAGAALATGFCPDVTMLICSTHFLGKHNQVGFHRPHLSIRRLIDCCKLGVSAFVGEIFSGVVTIIFNMLILGIAGNMGCLHLSGSGTADRRCKLAVYRSPGNIFNSEHNPKLLRYAHTGLRLYFLGFLAAGINILLVAYYSVIDQSRPAIIDSLLRGAVAIAVSAIVLAALFGVAGVWISFLASEMITFVVVVLLGKKR
uniref:MATE family efflux transporter n=1 Tax=Blautia faecicola TaxID=2509240 RepID=UPI003520A65B